MNNLLLVLDQGGQSSRVALFNSDGSLLQMHSEQVSMSTPHQGWVEQNPEEVVQSLRQCLSRIQIPEERTVIAGMVTQRSSLVCWDRETGNALTPILSWQDTRAADWLDQLSLNSEAIYEHTGLYPNAHFGASKMRWCLQHVPEVQRAMAEQRLCIGPLASYLLSRLLKDIPFVVDPANASRTLLYNVHTGSWDPQLMTLFDIHEPLLPAIQPSCSEWGYLTVGGREIPLRWVTGDQCAAIAGLGGGEPGSVVINAGTGAFIAKSLNAIEAPPERLLQTLLWEQGGERQFVAEGTVNGAASALQWATDTLSLPSFDQLDAWSATYREPPLFLNGIGGLASPFWRESFTSEFIGEGCNEAKMVAVLESIVFLLKCNLQQLCHGGGCANQIRLGGGLAGFDSFCQKLADATGLTILRPDSLEATAKGLAWLMADCPDWPEQYRTFYANTECNGISGRYERWCEAMIEALNQKA